MSQADLIRRTALEMYILPARAGGRKEVTIRAGDLHSQMKLSNAMPAVCSALRSKKFEGLAGVRQAEVTGPAAGANVYFRFDLAGPDDGSNQAISHPRADGPCVGTKTAPPVVPIVDLQEAVVLVSCVKRKLCHPAPARQLYCLDLFTKVRRLVEAQNAGWFVLSALYGLVPADQEIAPYNLTLNTMGVKERRSWAASVFRALQPELKGYGRVVFFAGERYREFLVEPIQRTGLQVDVPMKGLAIGEQLAWLSAHK